MSALRFVPALAFVALLAGPLTAGAQTPPPAPGGSPAPAMHSHHRHHRHSDAFSHALRTVTLTPAQQTQIAAFRAQTKKADVNADPATRKANMAKLHDQILGILTPAQKTQVTTAMQNFSHRRYTEGAVKGSAQPAPTASPSTK
jgi:Spy/CpxP family protein refolding chaperone